MDGIPFLPTVPYPFRLGSAIPLRRPLKGEVIALSDVQDEAFSSGALGLGAAVDPKEGVLYAPADGTISVFFPTGHAIGMKRTTEWNC